MERCLLSILSEQELEKARLQKLKEDALRQRANTRITPACVGPKSADYIGSIIGSPGEVKKNEPKHDPNENTGG